MAETESARDPRVLAFQRLLAVIDRLRAEDGCPWDRKQTFDSMAPHLLEECYEVVDALSASRRDGVREELGDLLMNVLLCARIAQDSGAFDLGGVASTIADKLVRRHPHVFGETKVDGVEGVLKNWEQIKKAEREGEGGSASALDGVPAALPALQRSARLVDKAATAGFVWQDVAAAREKLAEELGELDRALERPDDRESLGHELGDVLFAASALAHKVKIDPELAAREAASRFEARFRRLESDLGGSVAGKPLAELLAGWTRAKDALEREAVGAEADTPDAWFSVFRKLARARRRLTSRVRDLPPDRVRRKPTSSGGDWSVRDVLEHLLDVESKMGALFARMAAQAERGGTAAFPKDRELAPPSQPFAPPATRIEGPPPVPREDLASVADLLTALDQARLETLAAIRSITRFDPRPIVAPHPLLGPLDALQWGEFVAGHEARHLQQVERILAHLEPGSP